MAGLSGTRRRTAAPRSLAALLAVSLPVSLGLGACSGEDEPEDAEVPTSQETTGADCARIIPEEAVAVLGWPGDTGATYSSQGCERRTSQGYVKVRALTAAGAEPDEAETQQEFDERCAVLDTFPDPSSSTEEPSTGMLVTWLGEGVTACAVEPDGDIGLSKVLLVTGSGGLAELWVAALETTDQELVRESFGVLAETASSEL